jgi:hypothetical protein
MVKSNSPSFAISAEAGDTSARKTTVPSIDRTKRLIAISFLSEIFEMAPPTGGR